MRKRITAGLLAAFLVMSAGCQAQQGWTYENEAARMTSGTYLYLMMTAYFDAYSDLITTDEATGSTVTPENQKAVITAERDGVKVSDWIVEQAKTGALRYMGAEKKFKELGLEYDYEDQYTAYSMTQEYWGYMGDMTTKNSVSYESVYAQHLNEVCRQRVFGELYKAGSDLAGDEDQIKADFAAAYGKADYMQFYKTRADEEAGESQDALNAALKATAEKYKARMEAGEAIETLAYDYNVETAEGEEAKAAVQQPQKGSQTIVVSQGSTNYSETLVNGILEAKSYTPAILENDSYYYLINPMDVMADPADYEAYRDAFLYPQHEEEFLAMLEEWGAEGLTENKSEIRRYTAKKLQMDFS